MTSPHKLERIIERRKRLGQPYEELPSSSMIHSYSTDNVKSVQNSQPPRFSRAVERYEEKYAIPLIKKYRSRAEIME